MLLTIGEVSNWRDQSERLVYVGVEGIWHQFTLDGVVWCEVLFEDLQYLEKSSD